MVKLGELFVGSRTKLGIYLVMLAAVNLIINTALMHITSGLDVFFSLISLSAVLFMLGVAYALHGIYQRLTLALYRPKTGNKNKANLGRKLVADSRMIGDD